METLSIKRNKKKQVITLILDSVGIIYVGQRVGADAQMCEQIGILVGGVVIFSCIIQGIAALVKLASSNDSITISDKGITDGSIMTGVGLIEWNNIKEIKLIKNISKPYIAIALYNNKELLSRLSGVKEWNVRNNIKEYQVAVTIGEESRNYAMSEIEIMMNKALIEYRSKKTI